MFHLSTALFTDSSVYQARTLSARCVGEKTESNLVSKMAPIIIVHGGAGDIPDSRVKGKLDGMKVAVTAGHEILMKGGSALDAVEAAVVAMEKDENFNAGNVFIYVSCPYYIRVFFDSL